LRGSFVQTRRFFRSAKRRGSLHYSGFSFGVQHAACFDGLAGLQIVLVYLLAHFSLIA
jgi:hypothetical protein